MDILALLLSFLIGGSEWGFFWSVDRSSLVFSVSNTKSRDAFIG